MSRVPLAVVMSFVLSTTTTAQSPQLQSVLDDLRADLESPGAILGVRFPDGTAALLASGLANVDAALPIRRTDPFFLGSISKLYTSVVVLHLVDRGLVRLADPIAKWLPSFPRSDEITVRQLLHHTSGLRDFYQYLYYRPTREEMIDLVTRNWAQEDLLELAGRFGHSFEPGTDWAYSNTNYFLLGVLSERALGVTLPEAYESIIFQPLGIEHTWLTWHEEPRDRSRLPDTWAG